MAMHFAAFILIVYSVGARGSPTAVARFLDSSEQLMLSVRRDQVEMTCRIENLPLTDELESVQWRRISEEGDKVLPSDVGYPKNGNLQLLSFSPLYHTGNYSCVISTTSGGRYCSNTLQLRSSSVKIFPLRKHVEVSRNKQVMLSVIVRSPPGDAFTITWHKGSMTLHQFHDQSSITLETVTESDAGIYECLIRNSGGDDSAEITVVIVDVPVITLTSRDKDLVRGEVLELICTTNSTGIVTFNWTFLGKALIPSSRVSISDGSDSSTTLMVRSISYQDHGNYTCHASNLAGETAKSLSVFVTGKPEITGSSGGVVEEVAGTTVLLDCLYVSRPPPLVTSWHRDGAKVKNSLILPNNSLLLKNVGGANTSNYSCTVTNERGSDMILYQLTVLERPKQPGTLEKNVSSMAGDHSVLLSWALPGDCPPGQRPDWFKLEVWVSPAKTDVTAYEILANISSKTLDDLLPGETYHVQLQSYNKAGPSIALTTSFTLPASAPKLNMTVSPLPGGRSVAVHWELVYDGGPDVNLFTFDVYLLREVAVMVQSASPRLEDGRHVVMGLQPNTQYMVFVTIGNNFNRTTLTQRVVTTEAPPSQPSFFTVSMVTTSHIQLSFTVQEGSKSITYFRLNITTEGDREPVQTVITRSNQELVEVKELDQGQLAVKLMVSELRPFTRYTFQVAAVSEIGQGEFSSTSSPTKLKDGRIVYFMVVGVVAGVAIAIAVTVAAIATLVCRAKAAQKRKRTISITPGNKIPETSFILPTSKIPREDTPTKIPLGDTPTNKSYHSSSSSSSSHDVPALAVMDVNLTDANIVSDERLNRADSLAGDSCSYSVGMADHRLSVCQSEPGVAHHRPSVMSTSHRPSVTSTSHQPSVTSSSSSYLPHSQIHGVCVTSPFTHQPPHSRHHQLPLSQPHPQPGPDQQQAAWSQTGHHMSLQHQHSVDHHTAHLLPLPTAAISSSAPMINVRLSRESMLEPLQVCMTDV